MDIYILVLSFSFVQVSVGTLLAFTMVACSVLILRYTPPDVVPLTPSHQETIDTVLARQSSSTQKINEKNSVVCVRTSNEVTQPLIAREGESADPVIVKDASPGRWTCKSITFSPCLYFIIFSAILNPTILKFVLTLLDFGIP